MNTRLYWTIKKIFQKIVFDTKRLIYVLKEKFSKQCKLLHIQFDILKVVLWQIFLAIVFVLLLKKCDALLLSYLKLDSVSLDMFKDITIGGMGIAGVILGLYCANISSIFSAKYSNVPSDLATLYQRDVITNSCINQIIRYIVVCSIFLFECVFKQPLGMASIIVLLFLTVQMVITFSVTGNRSYMLSDTFSVGDAKFQNLYNIIKKVSKRNIFTTDQSFQNHYKKIASHDVYILFEIGQYNANIPKNQNESMGLFMNKSVALLEFYWDKKQNIQYDSLWFEKKAQYPQWHATDDTEIRLALQTGTSIQPKMVTDNYWFENALLKVNQECLNKILRDDDILVLQQYFVCLQSLTLIAGEKRQCDYWGSVLKKIKISSWTVICKHLSSDDLDKENALSIVDIMCSNYVELILGITRYLSNLNVESVLHQCTTYSSFDQCDIQYVPYLNGEMCKRLFTQISAELSIENKKLTANWYIQQIVAKEIYQYIGIVIGTIEFSIKEVYEIGIQLNTENHCQAAATALSHVFEILNKSKRAILLIEKILIQLENKHIEKSILWQKVSTDSLVQTIQKIETNLPAVLIKCSVSDALDHWKNREDYPDFLGLCYNHVSEALIRSIESNDFERFKKIYRGYFDLVLLYQEYIRTDVIKHKEAYLAEIVFHVASAPFFEYALISGLAIIWGEFNGASCWKDSIDTTLKVFIKKDSKNLSILSVIAQQLQFRQHDIVGIGNRDILQTNWKQRIAHVMSSSPSFEVTYDHFSERLKTASKILQSYRGITIMNHHVDLTNPEDVFMIVSVNNYLPDEKKYKSCWGWSENYES